MRINSKIAKFQEGGVAPAPQEPEMAPEQAQGGGDPIMQLAQSITIRRWSISFTSM